MDETKSVVAVAGGNGNVAEVGQRGPRVPWWEACGVARPASEKYPEGGERFPQSHPAFCPAKIVDADAGAIQFMERREKIAFVGFASSTRDKAPFDDPSYLIVGLNQLYRYIPRYDLWFEIHNRPMFTADIVRDTNYVEWLQKASIPIVMCGRQDDMPGSVRFPIERAVEVAGRDYFTCSPAYMVAWAILNGFKHFEIYGIDLIVGHEYDFEKACVEFWLGVARGLGVSYYIPPESALLKQSHRYGYETEPKSGPFSLSLFDKQFAELSAQRDQFLTNLNAVEGAMKNNRYWHGLLDLHLKGGMLPISTST